MKKLLLFIGVVFILGSVIGCEKTNYRHPQHQG
jgi:hypothetical protein